MARLHLHGTVALVAGLSAAVAWSGVTAAPTTVLSVTIDDTYPGGGAGVYSDAATTPTGTMVYADYRIGSLPLNWCVEAEPAPPGNLFVLLNRKLDGPAGVLRCSENPDGGGNPGVPRNFTLQIANEAVCDLLADPAAGLPLTDVGGVGWDASSSIPCVLAQNDRSADPTGNPVQVARQDHGRRLLHGDVRRSELVPDSLGRRRGHHSRSPRPDAEVHCLRRYVPSGAVRSGCQSQERWSGVSHAGPNGVQDAAGTLSTREMGSDAFLLLGRS